MFKLDGINQICIVYFFFVMFIVYLYVLKNLLQVYQNEVYLNGMRLNRKNCD